MCEKHAVGKLNKVQGQVEDGRGRSYLLVP